ncbi:MAG: 3-dehydroquinate synthase, partial [Gemmatimonadota bacterium]|nr:3-dehydroquinate synthase [Gemmatimonadota bacterium]
MIISTDRDARAITVDSYDAHVGNGLLERAGEIIRTAAPAHRYAIISDDNVAPLYAPRLRASLGAAQTGLFTIPSGEAHKTREQWAQLTDALLAAGFGRDSTILALGGGVIGDLAGFVAATYMRGIPFVQIPTTLLAMIDASIGGKTGVDTAAGKNLVGAFHRPRTVLVDPTVLTTLPREQLRAGVAEAIKHGAIVDAEYYESVSVALPALLDDPASDDMLDLIVRSITIKASIVRADEHEAGIRKILNFGHTFGHAIERCLGYGEWLHGEAVAAGMVMAAEFSERLGWLPAGEVRRIEKLLVALKLPVKPPALD